MEATTSVAPKDILETILTARELPNKFKSISHTTLKSITNLMEAISALVETSTTTNVVMIRTQ
jgi:hypothetical protein